MEDEWDVDDIFEAAENGFNIQLVEFLNDGVDPNIQDGFGFTPILSAIDNGHEDTVQLLLNAGADLTIRDNLGYTVLDQALRMEDNHDIIRLITRHITSIIIQSRIRGRQIRRKMRTQRAKQRLALAKVSEVIPDYDTVMRIAEKIDKKQYNPGVDRRMREEEEVNERMAEYLKQIGGRRKQRTRKKRYY